jgi:TonB family protein
MKLSLALRLALVTLPIALGPRSAAQERTQQETVYEFTRKGENGITAPQPLYHPDPEYTDRARRKKINGIVILSLVVASNGLVRDARVTTGLDKDLDNQALKAVRTWKFEPATKDSKPVAVRISVETSFHIR